MNVASDLSATVAPTYEQARERFLNAARLADASVETFDHPLSGPAGEPLALDVAVVGSREPTTTVIVVSATHGVEGFAGSALQSHWLQRLAQAPLPGSDLRLACVHGLNPYGFAWHRRVNEDNVDLNRNFVDWSPAADRPVNPGYGQLAELLVPREWEEETISVTTDALLAEAEANGFDWLQEAVSSGQYQHPKGLFYGGDRPVWSHKWLRRHLPAIAGPASRVVVIDLHTGLGPWGFGELLHSGSSAEPAFQRANQWWKGEVRSITEGESVSAVLAGEWLSVADELVGTGAEVTAVAIEYGTVDTVTVLQALRADAWLHGYGDPGSAQASEIVAQMRAAFCDDDPAWLAELITRFDQVVDDAIVGLGYPLA